MLLAEPLLFPFLYVAAIAAAPVYCDSLESVADMLAKVKTFPTDNRIVLGEAIPTFISLISILQNTPA